ncbi:MAG TPA: hypothetical protein VI278_08405 [Nitrososphaeraceae archaeon]
MTIKEIKEDQSYKFNNTHNEKVNEDNEDQGKQSEKASWWLNELDSLGIKKGNYNKNQSNYLQNHEDLSDNKKQNLIRDYRISHHSE